MTTDQEKQKRKEMRERACVVLGLCSYCVVVALLVFACRLSCIVIVYYNGAMSHLISSGVVFFITFFMHCFSSSSLIKASAQTGIMVLSLFKSVCREFSLVISLYGLCLGGFGALSSIISSRLGR